jgi:hypothetical protein
MAASSAKGDSDIAPIRNDILLPLRRKFWQQARACARRTNRAVESDMRKVVIAAIGAFHGGQE